MKHALLALFAIAASAQQLSFGPIVSTELSATVPVKLVSPTGTPSAAVEFGLVVPASVNVIAVAGASLAGSAAKTLTCDIAPGKFACIAIGPNANPIPDGDIAVLTFTATAPIAFSAALSNLSAASPAADPVTITAGAAVPVSLKSRCDLNADGITNLLDFSAAIAQAIFVWFGGSCTTLDITGSGKCNSADVQRVAIAVNGGVCRVGP